MKVVQCTRPDIRLVAQGTVPYWRPSVHFCCWQTMYSAVAVTRFSLGECKLLTPYISSIPDIMATFFTSSVDNNKSGWGKRLTVVHKMGHPTTWLLFSLLRLPCCEHSHGTWISLCFWPIQKGLSMSSFSRPPLSKLSIHNPSSCLNVLANQWPQPTNGIQVHICMVILLNRMNNSVLKICQLAGLTFNTVFQGCPRGCSPGAVTSGWPWISYRTVQKPGPYFLFLCPLSIGNSLQGSGPGKPRECNGAEMGTVAIWQLLHITYLCLQVLLEPTSICYMHWRHSDGVNTQLHSVVGQKILSSEWKACKLGSPWLCSVSTKRPSSKPKLFLRDTLSTENGKFHDHGPIAVLYSWWSKFLD